MVGGEYMDSKLKEYTIEELISLFARSILNGVTEENKQELENVATGNYILKASEEELCK
jgi:hypothetical protein